MSEWATAVMLVLFLAAPFAAQDEALMKRIGVVWTWEHLVAVFRRRGF